MTTSHAATPTVHVPGEPVERIAADLDGFELPTDTAASTQVGRAAREVVPRRTLGDWDVDAHWDNGVPGNGETYSQPGSGKYQPNTGPVRIFGSMDELKGYIYEPLAPLAETSRAGYPRSREELISALQAQAAELGANAIAIVEEEERAGEIWRIRANAVRITAEKEKTFNSMGN